jgi:hypothetical protein
VGFELGQDGFCDGSERLPADRQTDAAGAPVVRIALAFDQPHAFHGAYQRRHRLLAHTRASGEHAHTQAVLLEQGNEHRSVGGSNIVETGGTEALVQQLVPSLRRLREQVAEILAGRLHK